MPGSKPLSEPQRWPSALAAAFLALAALAAYHGCFAGKAYWDDFDSILRNPTLRDLRNLRAVFSPPGNTTVNGRPLLNFSFALNYAWSGTRLWSYHAVNLAIHILAGWTLLGIARRTLLQPSLAERFGSSATPLAFVIALLWTLHPLQTGAVTYVVQRAESMMGLFYLLSLYGFIRETEGEKAAGQTSFLWFGLSWLACLFGLATKETAATIPVLLLFYDRTFAAGSFAEAWRRRRWFYLALAAAVLAEVLIVLHPGGRDATSGFGHGLSWTAYFATQFPAVVRYLRLSVWPRHLVFYYEPVWHEPWTIMLPSVLLVAALAAEIAAKLRDRSPLGFLGLWFFLILAPTSLVPGLTETVAERRMYLPLAAVIVAIVLGTYRMLGRRSLIVFLAVALGLGWATERRNRVYASELALWSDTVAKRPGNSPAHDTLGALLSGMPGRMPEALAQVERAVALDGGNVDARTNLSLLLCLSGRPAEALRQSKIALRLKPGSWQVQYSMGSALSDLDRFGEAVPFYRASERLDPNEAETHYSLGNALSKLGRPSEAVPEYEAAVRINPADSSALNNEGLALAGLGRLPEAVEKYEAALRLDPRYQTYYNLGNAFGAMGRPADAIPYFEAAVKLEPSFVPGRYNLGGALFQSGQAGEAAAQYREIARLQPNWAQAHANLGAALLASGRPKEAASEYETALRLDPSLSGAEQGLAQARALSR